jgi:Zn-finger nucleic acid-binding protein
MLIACKSCHRQYDVQGMAAGERVRCRCAELLVVPRETPRVARTLHCSACGGKIEAAARRCGYCASEIGAAERNLGPACPGCYARLAVGAQFCSDCGIKIEPEALRAVRAASSCPRCKGNLVTVELPSGQYTECASCGGIWLDAATFQSFVDKRDAAALAPILGSQPKAPRVETPGGPQPVKYLPCPTCGSLMNRRNFGGCSGVIVDLCKGHGFWFDAFELEKVVAFIGQGGLDKARELQIQRTKQEIERLERSRKERGQAYFPAAPRNPRGDFVQTLGRVGGMLFDLLT